MRFPVLLVIPFAGVAASAQSPPAQPELVPRNLTDVTFGRSVVGDFSGHELPDIVVLASGMQDHAVRATALMLPAPSIHNTATVLRGTEGKTIRDIAVLRRGDPIDRRDALLLTTDQGLFHWTWDGTLVQLGGTNWLQATRVEAADVDGDEVPEAIGRMGDASGGNPQNIRFRSLDPNEPTWFVNTGQPVLDHLPVDWASNVVGPCDEVAIAHADGVRFIKDGALDAALTVSLPACVAARLTVIHDGSGGRCLVVGRTNAAGQSTLVAISPTGATWTCPLPHVLANLTPVSHGPLPGAVVATFQGSQDAVEFAFDPTAYGGLGFGPGLTLGVQVSANVGTADARRLDLDGDGDLDQYGPFNERGCVQVRLTPGGADQLAVTTVTTLEHITLTFTNPPAWAGEVEVVCFPMDAVWTTTGGQESGMEYLIDVVLLPQAAGRGRFSAIESPAWGANPPGVPSFPGVALPAGTDAIVTLMRYVQVDNEVVVRRGPFTALIWTADYTILDFLPAELPVKLGLIPPTGNSYPKLGGGGVGGAVDPPKLPPPEGDDPPDGGGGSGGGGG